MKKIDDSKATKTKSVEQTNELGQRRIWAKSFLLLCVVLWLLQVVACFDPSPLCTDEQPCTGGQLCVNERCICPSGMTFCDGNCVELSTNAAHCGSCGRVCDKKKTCTQGSCSCSVGLSDCDGTCTNLQQDATHCGTCNIKCRSGERCAEGACRTRCPDNAPTKCGDSCVNTTNDPFHCNSCGKACQNNQQCLNGQCLCLPGWQDCEGTCIDPGSNRDHCGGCGKKCKKNESCAQGHCTSSCPKGSPAGCFGGCFDTRLSREHCGGCGKNCMDDRVCSSGICQCPSGTGLCEGKCVHFYTNQTHCGGCGQACADGKKCAAGRCVTNCPKSTPSACFGGCFDTQTNALHCKECGKSCLAGQVCVKGSCQCPSGFKLCNGKCVDPKTDGVHCGECGKACPKGKVCGDGSCKATCPAGSPGICFGGCFDLKKSNQHCGRCSRACQNGQSCQAGVCVCPKATTLCGGLCVDTASEQRNCGQCGVACSAGRRCAKGQCVLDCDNLANCGGVCVDVQTDAKHCGDCDNVCKQGQSCAKGSCRCKQGFQACNGSCFDLQTNEQHCGKCGRACSTGELCTKGVCGRVCKNSKHTVCGGECVDGQTDLRHCGKCGHACEQGQSCNQGVCTCPTGEDVCGGQCTNLKIAPKHCGKCGHACASGEFCFEGSCQICSTTAPKKCGSTCCLMKQSCCSNTYCSDLQTDAKNCGACGVACSKGLVCVAGSCQTCADGQKRPCYTGSSATRGIGTCADGAETCAKAKWGACVGSVLPSKEICDNKDNNCDGKTDETFASKGTACSVGKGVCTNQGKLVCDAANNKLVCDAILRSGTSEACDNKDNDCNGKIDDNITGPPCAIQNGICKGATKPCLKGVFAKCRPIDFGPLHETVERLCDNKDNDCDGLVDEDLDRRGPLCANQKGWCSSSKKSCSKGVWAACTSAELGSTYQAKETLCDANDNDCDGLVDEGCTACLPTLLLRTLNHLQAARWLDFNPQGTQVAGGAFLSNLRIWKVSDGSLLQTIKTGTGPFGLQYSPFFPELAVSRNELAFYNPINGQLTQTFKSHTPLQNDVAYSLKGHQVATVGEDRKLIIWDIRSKKALRTITMAGRGKVVAWSHNDKWIAVGLENKTIGIWDAKTGALVKVLSGHTGIATSLAFSPDSSKIASAAADAGDKTLRMWSTSTWKQLWSKTSTSGFFGIDFRWDSKVMVVGQSIFFELRDVATGNVTKSIRAHAGVVADVAWSPDGKIIGTSSSDRTVKLWKCP